MFAAALRTIIKDVVTIKESKKDVFAKEDKLFYVKI